MGNGNNQVKMNLDRMKEAMETCKATAINVEAVIGDVKTTMTGLEDNYMGEDADILQEQMGKFLEDKVGDLCRNAGAMERALTQGLENARFCKDYCQHFPDALEGGANGAKSDNKEIPGNLFCDYDAVMGLMDMCTEAENMGEEIRQSTYAIERVLDLEVVSFDVETYTSAVRAECDKIERLGAHRRNLENYGDYVETTDRELAAALAGIYDTFMTPESAERSKLAYKSINVKIKKMQEDKKKLEKFHTDILIDSMDKSIENISEEDRRIIDEVLTELIENEEMKELKKIVDSMGDSIDGGWTAGEIYVAAKLLDYGENNYNEELLTEIYSKLMKERLINIASEIHTNTNKTTYTYEVRFDEEAVANILKELDPYKNGLAYYSLQRRSFYCARDKRVVYGSFPKEPGACASVTVNEVDGKLVSIIDVGGAKTEIESMDMNKVIGKEEIGKMLARGYTYEAIALGLTINQIEILERNGVHLTQTDIKNMENTMYRNNAKISSDHRAVIYHGKVYCIDVPTEAAVFEPIWNKDGTKEFSQMDFDLAAGVLGVDLEEMPEKTVIKENKEGLHFARTRKVDLADKNVPAAVALSLLTGLSDFIEHSLSSTNVEMVFESYGDNRRVRIYVGDSESRMNIQNCNLNIPRNIYAINSENIYAKIEINNATKALYQELTGKEVPNPDGHYTLVANLNEERKNMFYFGYLSYSENNELLYTPYVFPDEEAHISECSFMYGTEKENIYDCTELLKRTINVPADVREVLENAWEEWEDE